MTNNSYIYKNKWRIFPRTGFDDIYHSTCSNTLTGYCESSFTLDQCIDSCKGDCSYGYYVDNKDGSSICSNINSKTFPGINPVYGIWPQDEDQDLKNVDVTTFINTEVHQVPPNEARYLFYTDIVQIVTANKKYITSSKIIPDDAQPVIASDTPTNLQMFPFQVEIDSIMKWRPVRFGDFITFAIPQTSIVLAKSNQFFNMEWRLASSNLPYTDFAFQFISLDRTKKTGEIVSLDKQFNIVYAQTYVMYANSKSGLVELIYTPPEKIPVSDSDAVFQLSSTMTGYYCKNNKCTPVAIADIDDNGYYNGNLVTRSQNCINMCQSYSDKPLQILKMTKKSPSTLFLAVIAGFLLIGLIIFFYKLKFSR